MLEIIERGAFVAAIALGYAALVHAQDKPKTPAAPAKPALTCTLQTLEAPAGGRLEVTGSGFGGSPLVKIDGKVARLIDRYGDTVAVQISKKSKGGVVTVHASGAQAQCGQLRIIGQD